MPTYEIEIKGQKYEIDAPDDAAATKAIGGLTGGAPAPKQPESTGMDMLKSAGAGLAQGATSLIGLPGTIQNAFDSAVSGIIGVKAPPPSQLSAEKLSDYAGNLTNGATDYQPQTTAGEYTKTAAEFIPGSVLGPGSMAAKIGTGALAGLTSEGAGQAAEKFYPPAEPYARIAGGLIGGMAPSMAKAAFPSAQEAGLAEIGKAAAADNMTPQQMMTRLDELGPNSMVADLGPNFQGQAGAMANLPGRNNTVIRDALNQRAEGANARLGTATDNLGPRVIPSQVQEGIDQAQRNVGQQYGPVMQGATRVNSEPLANRLEAAITNTRGPEQRALQNVRGYLNIPGTDVLDPNPQALFATRQAIDGLLQGEQNGQVIRQLTVARQQVDDMLANAAPGIKDVDAQYSELARQSQALGEGQRALDSGRTAPRPEELAQRIAEGALPQGRQIGPSAVPLRLREGARADIDRIVGNNRNDIAAMGRLIKGEGDWNPEKLRSLFGEDRANQLMRVLDNERAYADTRNFATGNSLSANRLQYQKQYGGSEGGMNLGDYYGAGGAMGVVRGALVKGARKVAGKAMDSRNENINTEIARNLTGRDAVVAALMRQQSQGSRLAGPAKQALIRALLDQQARLGSQ